MARRYTSDGWNGRDFYYCAGEGRRRNWDDMTRYGFVSGGGGRWYSNTLRNLQPGHRVFAYIPKVGYVGAATVTEPVVPVTDFEVELEPGVRVPILEAPLAAPAMDADAGDPERREYLVRVQWQATLPRDRPYWAPGLFANENSVARLRHEWTLARLEEVFGGHEPGVTKLLQSLNLR